MNSRRLTAICACGAVEFEAVGKPIATVTCYCDDCQTAARQIEAMPGAASFLQSDGGTLLTWEGLAPRLSGLRARQIVITHMNPVLLAHLDEVRAAGVLVAADGDVIEL